MTDDLFWRALAKLSPEDQVRAVEYAVVFGSAFIEERADGTARLIRPQDLRIGHFTRRGEIEYQKPPAWVKI